MKIPLLSIAVAAVILNVADGYAQKKTYIKVEGTHFVKDGKPYTYIGTNYWYGALLASKKYGDRERLLRELDLMKSNGIDNLRILAGADGGTYDYTVSPALQTAQGKYDVELFDGLDFLLSQMEKRNMYAVLYLTNNWEWSGGMSQYLEWNGYGKIPNPNIKPNTWPQFMDFTKQFYSCDPCKTGFENHIRYVLGRTNAYTKKKYTEDPAIMAWQLANEPRIFSVDNEAAFTEWLNKTVVFIHKLDKNHLVSTGSEGKAGSNDDLETFARTHNNPGIDYLTMHIWPKNWGWFKAEDAENTLPIAESKALEYINGHVAVAKKLGKPIVIEEFGLPRANESLLPGTSTASRDAFYEVFFKRLAESKKAGETLAGINFWGFGGEGKAVNPTGKWNKGDAPTTDPPQEPQGLNSVFSTDASTLKLIKQYNNQLQ
ncbi:endo-1,4-beta-mannosidase [Flavobacterium noncentrifugens]|uniref:mannan endo-1,4-beta-mannosidase n=1 Tax=Flavobacterium noncentrifugens TaxID=1128970 RepID=A0A1G8WGF0_9FLAO|nr:cellulase family glycosylhydrolase [Flavobacterium noncentrifugens]GEP50916.1 endo-1,4-beta-mannosidase [Flavobacterium noncentrifugens]SDJ77213.1 mannan endo-1,4-beta-mannosidase [Flavobacterium noncentrifugens]